MESKEGGNSVARVYNKDLIKVIILVPYVMHRPALRANTTAYTDKNY